VVDKWLIEDDDADFGNPGLPLADGPIGQGSHVLYFCLTSQAANRFRRPPRCNSAAESFFGPLTRRECYDATQRLFTYTSITRNGGTTGQLALPVLP
jgi:hypothetical protein